MTAALDHVAALVRERDLDRYLTTLYAPPAVRGGLLALHALDLELAEVARSTTEPMLGQIRLAWWREQLQGLDAGSRPAQPILTALAEHLLAQGMRAASLEPLEDAYLALLDDEIDAHARHRRRLFGAAAELLTAAPSEAAEALGEGWAIVDVARSGRAVGSEALQRAAVLLEPAHLPRDARPLAALATLARHDLASLAAGQLPGPRGTMGRQARLAWSILSGR